MISRDHWSYPDDYDCGCAPALSDSLCGVIIIPLLEAFSGNPSLCERRSEEENLLLPLQMGEYGDGGIFNSSGEMLACLIHIV